MRANAWRWQARDAVVTEGFVSGQVHASYLHTHWNGVPGAADRITEPPANTSRHKPVADRVTGRVIRRSI